MKIKKIANQLKIIHTKDQGKHQMNTLKNHVQFVVPDITKLLIVQILGATYAVGSITQISV